jgi:O-antigen/teichoic acid export membrane protein
MTEQNLTRGTLANLRWTYGASLASALLQIVYTAIMGRLLRPDDFGLVAMALIFVQFGSYFAQMGVGPALVQREELTDREIRVGHTSSLLLGIAFSAVLAAAAPLSQLLFDAPGVVPLLRAAALTFALTGAGLTARSLLGRQLRFRALALIDLGSYGLAYLVLGLALALAGAGVWTLVVAALAQAALSSAFAYLAVRHPVRPLLAGAGLRALYGFGGRVTAISLLEFAGGNLDAFAVGRLAGPAALGQYSRAALLVHLPFHRLTTALSSVLFPTFSRIQADRDRVRGAYLSAVRLSAALILPTAAGIAVAAPDLVRVVLGPQWDTAARVLPFLALAAAVDMLSHFGGIVCEATGTLNRKLTLQVAYLAVLAGLLVLLAGGDLRWYAAALLGAELFRHGGYVLLMRRVLGLSPRDSAGAYLPALAAAAAVALVLAGVGLAAGSLGALPALTAQVLAGAATLALLARFGPLAGVRRELSAHLGRAGFFDGELGRGRRLLAGLVQP